MVADDLPRVLEIADAVHLDYPEEIGVFADRLTLFPRGCMIAMVGGDAVGYVVAHPARLGDPPPLDTRLGALAPDSDGLYLHDMALLPEARGLGLPTPALALLEEAARELGLPRLSLTSTPGALAYWRAAGFVQYDGGADANARLGAKLATYGGGMVHMWRAVAPRASAHVAAQAE